MMRSMSFGVGLGFEPRPRCPVPVWPLESSLAFQASVSTSAKQDEGDASLVGAREGDRVTHAMPGAEGSPASAPQRAHGVVFLRVGSYFNTRDQLHR